MDRKIDIPAANTEEPVMSPKHEIYSPENVCRYVDPETGSVSVWECGTQPERFLSEDEWEKKKRAPEPLTFAQIQEAKLYEINTAYSQAIKYIQAGYPLEEVLSWDVQATEAQELLKNPEAEAVFIRQLATTKGVSVEEMRDRILENSASWKFVAGMLTAQRQMMEEAVLMAKTVEGVEALKVEFTV